jgi:predicted  nucleic acid-binding Zn-ribbon protein
MFKETRNKLEMKVRDLESKLDKANEEAFLARSELEKGRSENSEDMIAKLTAEKQTLHATNNRLNQMLLEHADEKERLHEQLRLLKVCNTRFITNHTRANPLYMANYYHFKKKLLQRKR